MVGLGIRQFLCRRFSASSTGSSVATLSSPARRPTTLITLRRFSGMLDIKLFRSDPDRIRESQRRRGAPVELVDEIISLDKEWRQRQYELDSLRKDFNRMNKEIAQLNIANQDATKKIKSTNENKRLTTEKTEEMQQAKTVPETKLTSIRNLVHDSVPISMDKADSIAVKACGERRMEEKLLNHLDLGKKLGIVEFKRGAKVAGGRGYCLKGAGFLLNAALIRYGLAFLRKRNFLVIRTPYLMREDIMSRCAQLAQFDEELYKVTGEGKYLIATSEQPLCAYHMDEVIDPTSLPIRYAGLSTCFRKEAGSHGRDTLGIFRVHQFEKVEQFCITSPNDNESWEMHEEMLLNSEKFYQELSLPYQVVSIASGALNGAAAKKYDLEGWFPSSKTYRELVSCSNCLDYQARRLGIEYGQKKNGGQTKQYVHTLNSTLTATQRTICCILENHQTADGVAVPEALQPYMRGIDFLPFKN
ncbi:hypothetical protein KSP39_PZI010756 [Platanthera zijinensis]|uniref:serine--tRNA ligase n=1 Tax=Platanthera zijinensis TaxID=2320716 RepID=A0AAP0BJ54_9ASPA